MIKKYIVEGYLKIHSEFEKKGDAIKRRNFLKEDEDYKDVRLIELVEKDEK